jgi:polar amino acid transport system substrate-binding protein
VRLRIATALAISGILVLSTACSSGSSDSGSGDKSSASSASVDSGPAISVVTLPSSNPPQQVGTSDADNVSGFVTDLVKAAAAEMHRKVTFVPLAFAEGITAVQSGKYDVAMFINGTAVRYQTFDVASLYIARFTFISLKTKKFSIATVTDVCGKNVGYVTGGSYIAGVDKMSAQCKAAGKPEVTSTVLADNTATLLALKSGRIDLQVADVGVSALEVKTDTTLQTQKLTFFPVISGIGFKKGNTLAPQFTDAFNKLISNGTYKKILEQYGVGADGLSKSEMNPTPLDSLAG